MTPTWRLLDTADSVQFADATSDTRSSTIRSLLERFNPERGLSRRTSFPLSALQKASSFSTDDLSFLRLKSSRTFKLGLLPCQSNLKTVETYLQVEY
jgi:hypothetical protein